MNRPPKRKAAIESEQRGFKKKKENAKSKKSKERESATNRYLIEFARKTLHENRSKNENELTEIDLNYFDEHADDENEEINLHSNEEEVNHEEYENIREELEYSFQVENCQTQTHRMVEGFDKSFC